MSVALMTLAFRTSLPSTQKLVLLALCDCANDQGECYPSVSNLSEKCSLGERTIQEAISELQTLGYLRREFRNGRSTVYWLTPSCPQPPQQPHPRSSRTPQQPHPTPAAAAPLPPQIAHPTPAAAAPRTINEPSIEPSRNQRERAPRATPTRPGEVGEQVWADWLALRKAKRAPVTATVLDGAKVEAEKAGMTLDAFLRVWCQRGSQGLQADWLKPHERGSPPASRQSALEARNAAVVQRVLAKQQA